MAGIGADTETDDRDAGAAAEAGVLARGWYLLRLSRPRFWLYLAGPIVVAVAYAATTTDDLFTPTTVALFAYFLVPANVYLYGINDVFDRDVDVENPKKEGREVRFRGQRFVVAAVALSGLGLLALVPLVPAGALPWLGLYLLLATEYSAPPLRFKTTPFLDSLSNGLYVLPGVAAYVAVAGAQPPALAVVGGWLWTMAMHTFSAIPDIDPDRAAGIRTTATALGESRTYAYCGVVWALAALCFGLLDVRLGAVLALYPAFVGGIALSGVAVDRAYWWFPAVNTAVGAVLTMGRLWVMVHG
jgi:4-hydroxybenzoate polyprenyltransferase